MERERWIVSSDHPTSLLPDGSFGFSSWSGYRNLLTLARRLSLDMWKPKKLWYNCEMTYLLLFIIIIFLSLPEWAHTARQQWATVDTVGKRQQCHVSSWQCQQQWRRQPWHNSVTLVVGLWRFKRQTHFCNFIIQGRPKTTPF